RLQSYQCAKPVRMLMREMQHNAAANRAAHDNGSLKLECVNDVKDQTHIFRRSQLIFAVLPAGRRRGLAMPGHVKGDHTEVFCDAAVLQQAAILSGGRTACGAQQVKTEL